MVTEGAYGQLKGRWRILLRKCENSPEYLKTMTLACMVLHNICLDLGDTISRKLDEPLIQPQEKEGAEIPLGLCCVCVSVLQ